MKQKQNPTKRFEAFIIHEYYTGHSIALHLKKCLKERCRIDAFVAPEDIPTGEVEETKRVSTLQDSEEVFLIITSGVFTSEEVKKEIKKAMEFGKGKNIRPYRKTDIDATDVERFFSNLEMEIRQWSDFSNGCDLSDDVLRKALKGEYFKNYRPEYWVEIDAPVENLFALEYSNYLDNKIKEKILSGEMNKDSKSLLDNYLKNVDKKDPKYSIRAHLLASDYYHILDEYEKSKEEFVIAEKIAKEKSIRIEDQLIDLPISYGHILLHLNDLEGAKNIFRQSVSNNEIHPVLRSRDLFRLGEILVFQGLYDDAIEKFGESITICNRYTFSKDLSKPAYHILADDYRRMGTAYRLKGNYDKAKECYNTAERIYGEHKFRGKVWLLHEIADLYRAEGNLKEALIKYEEAKTASVKVFNINRVAHALLGICETNRMSGQIDTNAFTEPLTIYTKIGSEWGIANTFISQSLFYIAQNKEIEKVEELLIKAEKLCQKLNLNEELKLIRRIREGSTNELHPLSFF